MRYDTVQMTDTVCYPPTLGQRATSRARVNSQIDTEGFRRPIIGWSKLTAAVANFFG